MGANDLQLRKTVERPIENHARQEDRRFQRISDDVAQVAATAESALLKYIFGALGMHENRNSQFLRFCPEKIELRSGRYFAGNMAGDSHAEKPESLDRFLQLLHCKVGVLQRDGGQSDKAIGMRPAPRGE